MTGAPPVSDKRLIDVLIPTYCRPAALGITLATLCSQTVRDFRVVVSDQSEGLDVAGSPEMQSVVRALNYHGNPVIFHKHLPRRGMAEQRQFLLDQATAPYVLYLDDDLILEPDLVERLLTAISEEGCGFVGSAPVGLSYFDDIRPHEQHIEFWDGPVEPEVVTPGSAEWERYRLHNAANVLHVQQKLNITADRQRKYRLAWVGACVMYDTEKLREVGGFSFWEELPTEHSGEDVLVQLRVMARYGGCGIIPTGVYHQELATTITDRRVDAPRVLNAT